MRQCREGEAWDDVSREKWKGFVEMLSMMLSGSTGERAFEDVRAYR